MLKKVLLVLFFSAGLTSLVIFFVNSGRSWLDLINLENETSRFVNINNANLSETQKSLEDEYGLFAEMTIAGIKEIPLDDSPIQIEAELASNNDYTSYRASYTSEGNKIYGLLTIPADAELGQSPAVVFIHGYIPPSSYRTAERYVGYVDYLARNGLVVFKIDLRGHDQSEGQAGGAYFSNAYVLDTLNAVQALKTLPEVNPQEIGLWGHSMAGNVVARSIAVNPQISRAVIWAGAVYTYADMRQYGIQDSSYRRSEVLDERRNERDSLFESVGELDEGGEFWSLVSPVESLRNYPGKIQIHHAVNDSTVSIEYSRNLIDILENDPVDIELYEYSSGGHDIEGAAFNQAMARSAQLLTDY